MAGNMNIYQTSPVFLAFRSAWLTTKTGEFANLLSKPSRIALMPAKDKIQNPKVTISGY